VRVIESGDEPRLVHEQPHEARILGVRRQDLLEHDEAVSLTAAREEQLCHPTTCELAEDLVRTETRTTS
jgi:hypothetical protein